jgi:hypothetical protein
MKKAREGYNLRVVRSAIMSKYGKKNPGLKQKRSKRY